MKSKSYLLSFAKAKGNIAAVAFAAILMAANATVASAQNKATESNGTEKTVIGGVDDLYGVDPSSEHCTDTKVGTNQTDGNKIVCLYNVGAKKFLSIGGLWGTQAALDVSPHSIYYVLEWQFRNVFSSKQSGRFFCWLIYGYRLGKIYSKKWGIYGQRKF